MATGRREVAFAEATNGRSQHIFRKLEFAEPAQILDRSFRSEAVVANPKYAGKRGLSEAIPNRVVDEWEIANALMESDYSSNRILQMWEIWMRRHIRMASAFLHLANSPRQTRGHDSSGAITRQNTLGFSL